MPTKLVANRKKAPCKSMGEVNTVSMHSPTHPPTQVQIHTTALMELIIQNRNPEKLSLLSYELKKSAFVGKGAVAIVHIPSDHCWSRASHAVGQGRKKEENSDVSGRMVPKCSLPW